METNDGINFTCATLYRWIKLSLHTLQIRNTLMGLKMRKIIYIF